MILAGPFFTFRLLMKILKALSLLIALSCLLGFIAAFVVEGQLAARAKLYQRIEITEEAQLFGEKGTMIGTPQLMIIDDKSAEAGPGPDGSTLLNEQVLKEKGIYPLQLRSVREVAGLGKIALTAGFLIGLAGFAFAKSRLKRNVSV